MVSTDLVVVMVAPITAMANATERAKNATRTSILASLRLVSKKPPHKVTLGELPWISSSGAPALLNRNLGSTRTALTALRIWLDARSDLINWAAASSAFSAITELAQRPPSGGHFDCAAVTSAQGISGVARDAFQLKFRASISAAFPRS